MNIALLVGAFPPGVVGGAELQAEAWARRLAKIHRVTVVTRKSHAAQPDEVERDGFAERRLSVLAVPLLRTALDVRGIEHAIASLSPRPDVLLCFQTFISGYAGVRIQKRTGTPAIVWLRGEDEYRVSRWRTRALSVAVWRDARHVLVQSERIREEVAAVIEQLAPRHRSAIDAKLSVVPNGLELPAGPFGPGDGVLAVGRLIADKAVDVVVEAAATAGASLTVAGDGPERGRLEALARERGSRVRFLGNVPRVQLDALYRAAGTVVLASRRGEGMPNVLLEAMSYARPVIATPVAGVMDLLEHEHNGLHIPVGDSSALSLTLNRVRDEPGLAARLGAGARATAERFEWDRVGPQLDAVLAAVVRA